MEARKNSRKIAVQAVFQFFFSKDDINKILDEFYSYRIGKKNNYKKKYDTVFLKNIVVGVCKNEKKIIDLIECNLSKDWLIERLDITMRAIISLAVYELISFKNIPLQVIIDEYVSISKEYFDNNNTGFVNGILDTIAKEIRT
jgi:N utilization substance protein B